MAFKIADGFVEVHGRVDKNNIRGAATRAGRDSGDAFSRSMQRQISRDIDRNFGRTIRSALVPGLGGGHFSRVGKQASQSFWQGFGGGILRPNPALVTALRTGVPAVLGSPVGAAALVIGAQFAASFVAAALSSGALGLLGAGLLGAGALGVSNAKEVQEAWTTMAARVSGSFKDSARGLVPVYRDAIDLIGDDFVNRLSPRIRSIFEGLAPGVVPVTQSLLNSADAILSRIEPRMPQFVNQFLIPASRELPRLGAAVGDFFGILMDNSDVVADAFGDLTTVTAGFIRVLGGATVGLTAFFTTIDNMIGIAGPAWLPFLDEFGGWLRTWTTESELATFAASPLAGAWRMLRGEVTMVGKDLGTATTRTSLAEGAMARMAFTMSEAITAAGGLSNALDILNGDALNVRSTENAFQAAIDAATQSLKDNGAVLDMNTEKGRANNAALDAIATTARDAADAVFEETKKTEGMTAAKVAAIKKLEEGREALIAVAVAMGATTEEAEALADEILGIPKHAEVDIATNAAAARRNIRKVRDDLYKLDGDTAHIYIRTHGSVPVSTLGTFTAQRYGGVHYAQQGLVKLGNNARLFPGTRTLFGFSEPGTGGEGFVAKNAPRQRSLSILDVMARWHRAVVVPMERMALTAGAPAPAATSSQPMEVHLTIEMDGQVIDRRIVRVTSGQNRALTQRVKAGSGRAL